MKSFEQFRIVEREVYISKEYFAMSNHAALSDGYASKELRYCICGSTGVRYLPASVYEGFMRNECMAFSSYYIKTRNYKKDLDKTYFRYYDDAKEVLDNLVSFYRWAHNQTQKKMVKVLMEIKADVMEYQNLDPTILYPIGLPEKMRKNLSPLARMFADDRDLVGADN